MKARLPAQERKEQLLDCALDLFAKHGYARATTAQLARMAQVTEPIIYRHFESKRDLFVALIQRTAVRTLEHWSRRLEGITDPAERLRLLLADNPMTHEGAKEYRVLLQAITEMEDDEVQVACARHFLDLHAFIAGEISQAQEHDRVPRIFSAELIAWILIDVGLGYGVLEALRVPKQGEDKKGMSVRDVMERLLVRRAQP
jgi:AcrR family transcriptional regulator